MKKVVLSAMALMFAAVGFSQVTDSNGNASPVATTVPILAGAAATANSGLSIQNGDDNKVRVRQAGTNQSVYTFQNNGDGMDGANQAFVRQTGAVSAASGVENRTDVLQSGEYNSSMTIQEGDYNDAITRQGQIDGTSSGNKALIRQGTGQQAESNFAAIDQDGVDNQARTKQTYDNSDAWTQQTGDENKSLIIQNAGPNGTDGHYAMNEQIGDRNESYIAQQGNGARNSARTLQIGDDNQANQMQTATDGMGGIGNDAGIMQGFENATQRTLVIPEALTQWLSVINLVDPDANPFEFDGPAVGNKAKQTQVGSDNSAGIYQLGGTIGFSNYSEQEQDGTGNNAGSVQGHWYSGDPSNYIKQKQDGDYNTTGIVQTGADNKSFQNQVGNLNSSLAFQQGKGHKLNTHQFGDSNVAQASQSGLENRALIVQYDGQSYTVEQNKNLGAYDLTAGGNQADILQMGPDGNFEDGAIDCYFDDPMSLDQNYNVPGLNLGDICEGC